MDGHEVRKQQLESMANIGDLIGIDGSRGYDHGCRDYAIYKITKVIEHVVVAECIEAQSCHSCWQVGHDTNHSFAEKGERRTFTTDELQPASDTWAAGVKWEWR